MKRFGSYSNRSYSTFKPRSLKRLERKGRRNLIISIILLLIFIYFLISWGIPYVVGSLSVFNKFKTVNIEKSAVEDITLAPPVLNIPFEATNTASIEISGYALANAEVEIYVDDNLQETVKTEPDGSFKAVADLTVGTNNIHGKTIDLQNNRKSLDSKDIKIIYNNEKPTLEVLEPEDNKQIKGGDKKTKVSGSTETQNNVTINGTTAIVQNDGKFSLEIPINEGDNQITIQATNQFGSTAQIQRKVNYSP